MNFVSQYEAEWTLLLTGALISTLPLLLVYISAQKHVVQGFVHSGIKG
jgi:multiple sugar transport system permease protein